MTLGAPPHLRLIRIATGLICLTPGLLAAVNGGTSAAGSVAASAGRNPADVGVAASPRAGAAMPGATPDPALGALDRYIDFEMRTQRIPGLSLAVYRDGEPLYVKSFGLASLELPVRAQPDTRFQIGSIGKQFTAAAVMLLVREGKLGLDDPLSRYLPEIPAAWRGITLRQMLKHQSGIPQLTPPDRDLLDLHHDYTDEEYIRLATSVPLDFEPGTDASYSDTAYVLLGIVIDRVAHEFYGDLLGTRVLQPLGMDRTRILSDTDIIPGRAAGYVRTDAGDIENQGWVARALNRTADGSLYSTVLDLGRWDAALGRASLLTRQELDRMWTVDPLKDGAVPLLHYGYGWEINRLRGHRVIEYDGNWQGFQSAMARYDDRRLTVIVLTNLSLCRVQRIAHTVAGHFDPEIAHFRIAASDTHPDLTRDFRTFIDTLSRRDSSSHAQASPGPRASTGVGSGERNPIAARQPAIWQRALARDLADTGPVKKTQFAEERTIDAGLERVYRVETEKMMDFFTVRYDQHGAVQSVDLYHEY